MTEFLILVALMQGLFYRWSLDYLNQGAAARRKRSLISNLALRGGPSR